jgi:periplasmic divalent cation tolerance protein
VSGGPQGRERRSAVVVLTTAGSRAEAERLATALVEARLAACVNLVGPVASIYRWRGAVERNEEVLLVIKTRQALVADVGACVKALHSYEVPELVALPVVAGARSYLAWLAEETSARPRRGEGTRRTAGKRAPGTVSPEPSSRGRRRR